MANPNPDQSNLIPLNKRSLEDAKRIQTMGGLTPSPSRDLAKRISWLKKKGLNDESAKYLQEVMTNPEISALDIRMYLEELKKALKDSNKEMSKIQLAKTFIDLHKAHHGEKLKTENLNLNVNVNIEEWERRLYDGEPENISNSGTEQKPQ